MMTGILLRVGDRLPVIRANLTGEKGQKIDLTGASVRILVKPLATDAAKVDSPCTVTAAADGAVEYAPEVAASDTAGEYRAWFVITDAAGKKLTVPNEGYIPMLVSDGSP